MAFSLFRYIPKITVFVLSFLVAQLIYADVMEGLYSSTQPVVSQQARDRGPAFNAALKQVLMKVSGNPDIFEQAGLIQRFYPAEKYVISYAYEENPELAMYQQQITAADSGVMDGSFDNGQTLNKPLSAISLSSPPLPYLLKVEFSEKAIEKDMSAYGLSIWGSVRPSIQFWVVAETDGQRQLLGKSNPHVFMEYVHKDALRFGIPVTFPEADMLDLQNTSLSGLWGLFPDALDQAKSRYSSDGQVILKLYNTYSNAWSANWYLTIAGTRYSGSMADADLAQLSEQTLRSISRILAERFAIKPNEKLNNTVVQIEVTEINSFKDYADVQGFLRLLAPVKRLVVNWVEGKVVSFTVNLNTDADKFFEYILLSGKLKRVEIPAAVNVLPMPVTAVTGVQAVEPAPEPYTAPIERFRWQAAKTAITPIER